MLEIYCPKYFEMTCVGRNPINKLSTPQAKKVKSLPPRPVCGVSDMHLRLQYDIDGTEFSFAT